MTTTTITTTTTTTMMWGGRTNAFFFLFFFLSLSAYNYHVYYPPPRSQAGLESRGCVVEKEKRAESVTERAGSRSGGGSINQAEHKERRRCLC
ncbi:hypothetical protein FN846DRAFT_931164 [Sphaerosporella brunnea]|uniref:Uncharacterized protein n=1 Tax=Sphaerosporella brunnea TaxID=1250544 RepID=A0A5J5F7Y7_9PEZI|nr:hypothetical protein FN846DRAFT_931164 [Sphaerosporella brunnea]